MKAIQSWTTAKDQLPAETMSVDVLYRGTLGSLKRCTECMFHPETGFWWYEESTGSPGHMFAEVIYWMPVPEFPEESS